MSTSKASQRLHAGDLFKKKNKSIIHDNPHKQVTVLQRSFIPGRLIRKRNFHSSPNKGDSLNPYYVTGFSDGEASFHVSIVKNKNFKVGYQVSLVFTIQLHIKDLNLIEKIKSYFGVGIISIKNKDGKPYSVIYSVKSLKDILTVIIPHFDKYPLLTKKRADFILFKLIAILMSKGEHLTMEGLNKIISIKASMNKGLSETLQKAFPNIIPIERPIINSVYIDNQWLTGFTEAEGCFLCLVRKNTSHLIGYQVTLSFTLSQHIRDLELMVKIKETFGFGIINTDSAEVRWTVTKKADIDTLITFFNKNPLLGSKKEDFKDFSNIQDLINKGLHKTEEGLNKIRLIKENMNKNRK